MSEMTKTFNLGIGYVLVVAKTDVDTVCSELAAGGEEACLIGTVCERAPGNHRL